MNRVDKEIIESAQLDGITVWKEFWSILFPMIFNTWSMGVVIGFSSILTSNGPLYLFWEFNAPRDTIRLGYLTYRMTMVNGAVDYPRVAVINLMGTAIVYPLTMLLKRYLEKVDPLGN